MDNIAPSMSLIYTVILFDTGAVKRWIIFKMPSASALRRTRVLLSRPV